MSQCDPRQGLPDQVFHMVRAPGNFLLIPPRSRCLYPPAGLPRKLSLVWNYVSVMPCNPTVRVGGDDDGLRIPVLAVPVADVVVDKEHRFEAPNTRR